MLFSILLVATLLNFGSMAFFFHSGWVFHREMGRLLKESNERKAFYEQFIERNAFTPSKPYLPPPPASLSSRKS